jgi:hypothetical protein
MSNSVIKGAAQTFGSQPSFPRRLIRSCIDSSFPYVLLWGMLGTIVCLASVWIVTALSFAPVVGA